MLIRLAIACLLTSLVAACDKNIYEAGNRPARPLMAQPLSDGTVGDQSLQSALPSSL